MILVQSILQGILEVFKDIKEMDNRYYLIAIVLAIVANSIAVLLGGLI